MKKYNYLIFCGMLFGSTLTAFAQETITVNKSIQHQTIGGFGAALSEGYQWGDMTEPVSAGLLDDAINDLGLTVFRQIIDGTFEAENDNNDPNNLDLSKFVTGLKPSKFGDCDGNAHTRLDIMATNFKNAAAVMKKNGDTLKSFCTVFSPPAWMKYIKCISGLDPLWNRMASDEEEISKGGTNGVDGVKDFKAEFAEFCYAYLKIMENYGVKIDVLSIQNEPVFPQPYSSCVYSAEAYAALFKTVGQRIRKEGFNTKMMFTEDIGDLGRYNTFVKPITSDPISSTFADIAAVHAYASNGISAGSTDASLWKSLDKVSRQRSPINAPRQFWETETSGYSNDYNGAIDLAISIYTGLKYGKTNVWCFHGLTHPTAVEGLVIENGKKTERYYAMKHFAKYIRPGAIQVESASTTDSLLVSSFQNNKTKKLTLVVINHDKTKSYKFKIAPKATSGFPVNFVKYISSNGSDLCKESGSSAATATIEIPANSIMTLVGDNSLPEIPTANDEAMAAESNFKLQVYPNPSQGGFYIQGNKSSEGILEVKLLNLQGAEIQSINYSNDATEMYINTENLTNGIYMLKYNNQYQKVIIQ